MNTICKDTLAKIEAAARTPVPGRKIAFAHMGIGCFDLEKMVRFYTEVMGLTVSDRGRVASDSQTAVFMTTDPNDHHQFVLVSGRTEGDVHDTPVVGGSVGTALFQVSFRLDSLATLRAFKARLETAGITNITPRNHGNAWSIYTRDPEGNAVELFVDTPWFVHQPFGEWLDLSLSDDEIYELTLAKCREQADFKPYPEWRAEMADAVAKSQDKLR